MEEKCKNMYVYVKWLGEHVLDHEKGTAKKFPWRISREMRGADE